MADIAADCGWDVEREMLRIPSTRNAAVVGRRRTAPYSAVDVRRVVASYGGATGYAENVAKLVQSSNPCSH